MTTQPSTRQHLVERAMEALGGTQALTPRQPSGRDDAPPPPADAVAAPSAGLSSLSPAALPPTSTLPAADAPTKTGAVRHSPPPIGLDALRRAGWAADASGGDRTLLAEELSVLQNQVLRTAQGAETADGRMTRLVLVTSAKSKEGKTFCALHIAVALALSAPEHVILVDGDSKPDGTLSQLLDHPASPGLRLVATDLMQRPEMLVIPTAIPRLSFLPYGPPAAGAPGLPSGAMLAAALGRLSAAMPGRLIILDAPPCLSASEPSAIAAAAGQVVLVVRAESTQRGEVEGALDMVEACPNLQLVLNRTRLVAPDVFGGHGNYAA